MSDRRIHQPLAQRLPGARCVGMGLAAAMLLFALLLTWAATTEVEVVTTAPAAARSGAGTLTVRAPTTRGVRGTLVQEGARVDAGQPLLRLESKRPEAELRAARMALATRRRALADQRAVLALLDGTADPATASRTARLRAAAQRSRLAQLDGEIEALRTELRLTRRRAAMREELRAVAEARARSVQRAGELGAVSRFDVLGARQAYLAQRAELDESLGRVTALEQRLVVQGEARKAADLAFRESLVDTVAALEIETAEGNARLVDAAVERRQTTVVAPAAGVVDRLFVRPGDFVERGAAIAVIVPVDPVVYFEVRLAPMQMGFLRAGLPCRLKLDALSFPRYGALPCTLTRLGGDAVTTEHGSHYLGRVEPSAQALLADGATVRLQPGATAWVDIVAGRRSVLGFVTEPLQRFARESLRER
ncbi:MAG: HlyD family efflux transporter periplasmic adaptor subunit [Pseudomonadales bacterium]